MSERTCSPHWRVRLKRSPAISRDVGQDTLRHRIGVGHLGQPVVISAGDPVLVQRVRQADGAVLIHVFNTGDQDGRAAH